MKSAVSPGRTLSKAETGAMTKSDRKNPPVKVINNRYPQVRKSGRKAD